jgi:hypothetical protein
MGELADCVFRKLRAIYLSPIGRPEGCAAACTNVAVLLLNLGVMFIQYAVNLKSQETSGRAIQVIQQL